MEKAEGAGKGICRDFDAYVGGSTLEIHLYWTGKGTYICYCSDTK